MMQMAIKESDNKGKAFWKRPANRSVAAALMVIASLFLIVEGTWGPGLFHHWTFITIVVLTILSLGFTVFSNTRKKSYCALMSHLGLMLVLAGGLIGAISRTDVQMRVFRDGQKESTAFDADGKAVTLPFCVELKEFETEYYDDGYSPKQYTSTLDIEGRRLCSSVNHPARYRGYRIYQSGYDTIGGSYSILKIVRDPWLPVVALGALLLAIAAIVSLKTVWSSWKILPAAVALAFVFTILSVARIRFDTLMPALRSLWFVPHLLIYMLAYSIMALSVISAVATLFSKKVPEQLPERLLSTSSSLLLIGILCGAVWAQQAWGDYWTWDTKECWAAVTWILTLVATHIPKRRLLFTILAFIALQITWYGVNYLPAANKSLHTYISKIENIER